MAQSSYDLLILKLDRFTKKYYLNKLIRGVLIFSAIVLASYLFVSLTEYWAYLKPTGRIILSSLFVIVALTSASFLIAIPLLQLLKMGKVISHEHAARIIGQHFSDVQDKLLNILQLKSQASQNNLALVEASINQKTDEIKLVPFANAVDLSDNRKYLRYVLPVVFALAFLLFKFPNVLKDSNHRLANPTVVFEKPAPFKFEVSDLPEQLVQYEFLTINMETVGESLPEETTIYINEQPFLMRKEAVGKFSYDLERVKESTEIVFEAGKFKSKPYNVKVVPKPLLSNFEVTLHYPNYIGKKKESLTDVGDLNIPQGTSVEWELKGINTDQIDLILNDELTKTKKIEEDLFQFKKRILSNSSYTIYSSNKFVRHADSLSFDINVIKDEYPSITAVESIDTTNDRFHYFNGNAFDDYGFSRLLFVVEKFNASNQKDTTIYEPLSLRLNSLTTSFSHFINLNDYQLSPGGKTQLLF